MTDARPSDRAISQAFWEWRTRSNYFRAKYSASIWVEERAAELDATAAPVVVGEDMVRLPPIDAMQSVFDSLRPADAKLAKAAVMTYIDITNRDNGKSSPFDGLTAALAGD